MELTRDEILNVLGNIIEPDLKKDIVSLNLIEELSFSENAITLIVSLSNPALHARKRMQEAVEFNLKRFFGQEIQVVCTVKGLNNEDKKEIEKIVKKEITNF